MALPDLMPDKPTAKKSSLLPDIAGNYNLDKSVYLLVMYKLYNYHLTEQER